MVLKRLAIIGAGASGLAQAKQAIDAFSRPNVSDELELVVFESKDEVGGVWYSKETPKPYLTAFSSPSADDVAGPSQAYIYPPNGEDPSAMYEGLHTNLPCDLMAFRDFEFPDDTPAFPDRAAVQQYLEEYAAYFDLRRYVRFKHRVTRLFHTANSSGAGINGVPNGDDNRGRRRWTIEYVDGTGESTREEFDFVSVANGHYADGWIPAIPGLEEWKGTLLHSRFFRRASDFRGKRVVVVGSFASGGDISRLIAGLNVGRYTPDGSPLPDAPLANGDQPHDNAGDEEREGYTKVYVSASGPSPHSVDPNDPTSPWAPYITWLPLISYIGPPTSTAPSGVIHFQDGSSLDDIDVLLYATGYNYTYPFLKSSDAPWDTHPLLPGSITPPEMGGQERDVGGLIGLGMKGLDPLMMFLDGDRTIAFPTLLPFPMAETQARLAAFLWAGLLPPLPKDIVLPPNPNNPYSSAPPPVSNGHPNGTVDGAEPPKKAARKVFSQRQALVFGAPYEWTYQEYLMDLMLPAYAEEEDVPECWRRVEGWRKDRRADAGLRKKVLGY